MSSKNDNDYRVDIYNGKEWEPHFHGTEEECEDEADDVRDGEQRARVVRNSHVAGLSDAARALVEARKVPAEPTTPDNAAERRALAKQIEDATNDDYVTTTEAAAVVAWCREWVADTFAAADDEPQTFEESKLTEEALLRGCHRHIDGGLAFVLADVRQVAKNEAWATWRRESKDGRTVYAIRFEDGSLSDDVYRTREDADAADRYAPIAGAQVIAVTWDGVRGVWIEHDMRHCETCGGHIGIAADNDNACTCDMPRCPACGDVIDYCQGHGESGDPRGAAILAAHDSGDHSGCHPAGCEDAKPVCEHGTRYRVTCGTCGRSWCETCDPAPAAQCHWCNGRGYSLAPLPSDDDDTAAMDRTAGMSASEYLRTRDLASAARHSALVDRDAHAARIAKEAADAFAFDAGSEDEESAAQRAADILRDLAAEDVPAFLLRVFGMPEEERHAEREIAQRWPHGVPTANDHETLNAWRMLRERAREDRGILDVARVLVFEYRDVLAPLAFAGHEERRDKVGTGHVVIRGESTNLSAWREACAAWQAVNELRAHAFGGCSLDGQHAHLDALADAATAAMLDSVRWAAFNAATAADGASFETGMPRSE